MAQDEIGARPEIFANHFWGKDEAGYEALVTRLREARQTCEELKTMFHERAVIEEDYGRRLLKLSKAPLGKDETGTLREALETTRTELETSGNAHIELAQRIRDELQQQCNDFITQQKEKKREQTTIVDKSLRNKQLQMTYVQRVINEAKEKYDGECIKLSGLIASKQSARGKELERLNMKIEKAQQSSQMADQEYKHFVKTMADLTQRWIYDWKAACDTFQTLEEERIEFTKTKIWAYSNLIAAVLVQDDESCERIRMPLEKCDVAKDIATFIKERATGPQIPGMYTTNVNCKWLLERQSVSYVNFYATQKDPGPQYTTANFERNQPYVIKNAVASSELDSSIDNQISSITSSAQAPLSTATRLNTYTPPQLTSQSTPAFINDPTTGNRRASLYASVSSSNVTNTTTKDAPLPATPDAATDDEPLNPQAQQILSVGSNQFSVNTTAFQASRNIEHDPIAAALAELERAEQSGDNLEQPTASANYTPAPSHGTPKPSIPPTTQPPYKPPSQPPPDYFNSTIPQKSEFPPQSSQAQPATPPNISSTNGAPPQPVNQGTVRPDSYRASTAILGITLDAQGRVIQDSLADEYVANGNRLPLESARFQSVNNAARNSIDRGQSSIQAQQFRTSMYQAPNGQYGAQIPSNASMRVNSPQRQSLANNPASQPPLRLNPGLTRNSTIATGYPLGSGHPPAVQPGAFQQNRGPTGFGSQTSTIQRNSTIGRPSKYGGAPGRFNHTADGKPILFHVRAMYDYTANAPEEMSFRVGDIIAVFRTQDDGWWDGEIVDSRVRGLLPSNFVVMI
ncbi:8905_t:CDS:10 [Paraglomus brasilianum]|uniref:8905_t:CDS:1 n=1 Tax=Paraglomus brasilianum TaxID=144538 RepID=A0A9N8W2G1_9GLOM|nr:8905_t:CDS:10 [Paraglomus brasilianum]